MVPVSSCEMPVRSLDPRRGAPHHSRAFSTAASDCFKQEREGSEGTWGMACSFFFRSFLFFFMWTEVGIGGLIPPSSPCLSSRFFSSLKRDGSERWERERSGRESNRINEVRSAWGCTAGGVGDGYCENGGKGGLRSREALSVLDSTHCSGERMLQAACLIIGTSWAVKENA